MSRVARSTSSGLLLLGADRGFDATHQPPHLQYHRHHHHTTTIVTTTRAHIFLRESKCHALCPPSNRIASVKQPMLFFGDQARRMRGQSNSAHPTISIDAMCRLSLPIPCRNPRFQIPGDPFPSLSSLLDRERWKDRLLSPWSLKRARRRKTGTQNGFYASGSVSEPSVFLLRIFSRHSAAQRWGRGWSRTGYHQIKEHEVYLGAMYHSSASHSSAAVSRGVGGGSMVECRASWICCRAGPRGCCLERDGDEVSPCEKQV